MLKGYQFDKCLVDARADASLYSNLNLNWSYILPDRGNMMSISTSGLNVIVNTGQANIQGRLVEITAPITVAIPQSSTGYLVIEIDLTKINTSTGTGDSYQVINNQLSIKFVNVLVQGDLHNGGTLYHFNLGSITSSTTTVTFTKNENAYNSKLVDLSNKVHNFLNRIPDRTITADTGYSLMGVFSRYGKWVHVSFPNSNATISAGPAGSVVGLAAIIPLGYRPKNPVVVPMIGRTGTTVGAAAMYRVFYTDGGAIYLFYVDACDGILRTWNSPPIWYETDDI